MSNFIAENRFDFRKMTQEELFEHFHSGFIWGRRHEKFPYQYWDNDITSTDSITIGPNAVDNRYNLAIRTFARPVADSSYKIGILRTDKWVKKGCKVSASIKLPAETGVWPGFWLTAHPEDDKGWPREIDILEGYNREGLHKPYDHNRIFGHTLQSNGHYGTVHDHKEIGAKTHRVRKDVTKNYITYEMTWEDDIIVKYNGRKVRKIKDKDFLNFIAGAKMSVMFSLFLMPGRSMYPPVTQMLVNELTIIAY